MSAASVCTDATPPNSPPPNNNGQEVTNKPLLTAIDAGNLQLRRSVQKISFKVELEIENCNLKWAGLSISIAAQQLQTPA